MIYRSIAKILSANDIGATGGHQGGILIPKRADGLLEFFPSLDPTTYNPDAWIRCEDEDGGVWKLRYVYYNNRLHTPKGTRNEYRLTYLTAFMKRHRARIGDSLIFTGTGDPLHYKIALQRKNQRKVLEGIPAGGLIKLRGWRRIH